MIYIWDFVYVKKQVEKLCMLDFLLCFDVLDLIFIIIIYDIFPQPFYARFMISLCAFRVTTLINVRPLSINKILDFFYSF